MGSKGKKKKAATERADFLVRYHAALDRKIDGSTIDRYYGPRLGGPAVSETGVREYDEGTLLLDMVDRQTGRLLWRGSAQARVTGWNGPAERKERVENAVEKMLAKSPPPPDPAADSPKKR